jgi:micrococcal nuclease
LIGVNTPETVHPSKPVEQFGKEASEFTRTHLEGKTVYLTYDQNRQDKYGRVLAYVWLPVEFRGETKYVLWNVVLILNGYGNAYTDFAFKEEYMEKFRELECHARKLRLGLWSTSTEPQKAQGSTSTGPQKTQESTPVESQETEDVKTYNVKIVTIQYKGKDEYIVIQNFGTSPVNLAGWKIFSKGGQWYTFPNITPDPCEIISVNICALRTRGKWNPHVDEPIHLEQQR